jgi:gliding motility-associated-like protein
VKQFLPFLQTHTLTGYNLGICPQYDTLSFTIKVGLQPVAEFEINPNIALIENPQFSFTNKSTGASIYRWYRGNFLFSTSTNPYYTEQIAGNYCYKLIAENSSGCIDSITHCANLIKDERVFFPNAFSPNRDAKNDQFKPLIININLASLKNYNFMVVNRFGQVVFKANNPQFGWDGAFKGVDCEIGTYYYMCKFKTPEGREYDVKGDVTLVK